MRFLLAADIDGTLLGDPVGETWLKLFVEQNPQMSLAYVTGRYAWSVQSLIAEQRLPQPHFICCNVGTEIIDCLDQENNVGRRYAAKVAQDWNLDKIYRMGEGEGIRRQEFELGQPPFQAGFYWDGRAETLAAFRQRLADLSEYSIYPSYDAYIDVLPASLGKGKAVQHLQQELGLDPGQVVVAGDSGNDREMFETGFQGIVPSNALDELKSIARHPWHYHSPYPAARGVMDGLRHFGFPAYLEPE